MKEHEIIALLRKREEKGAEELLHSYGPLMRYIISPILKDERDREDALSETVLRIWEKIDFYQEERGSWTSWLTAITRNTALNYARKQKNMESYEEISEEVPSANPTPEEHVLQTERRNRLCHALYVLSQTERMLFYRKYYYRQSTAQIACELGMTERAVEGKLYRIKKKLREALGGDTDE